MLGSGLGTVSLAFFVETVINELIGINGNLFEVYNQYVEYEEPEKSENESQPNFKKIPDIITDYFKFFELNFSQYYPQKNNDGIYSSYKYQYYLLKAPGVYALLKIFNDIFPKIDLDDYKQNTFYEQLYEHIKSSLIF